VEAVLEEYRALSPSPCRLSRVRVVAGKLHQIVPDYLTFAYELLTKGTPVEGSVMDLEFIPVRGMCRACPWEGEVELPVFRCGRCGGFEVDVISGRELFLDRLEVEQDE